MTTPLYGQVTSCRQLFLCTGPPIWHCGPAILRQLPIYGAVTLSGTYSLIIAGICPSWIRSREQSTPYGLLAFFVFTGINEEDKDSLEVEVRLRSWIVKQTDVHVKILAVQNSAVLIFAKSAWACECKNLHYATIPTTQYYARVYIVNKSLPKKCRQHLLCNVNVCAGIQ